MAQAHPRDSRSDIYTPMHSSVTPAEAIRTTLLNRITWGAVFAGMAMAFAVQLILNLIGVGIGIAAADPGTAGGSADAETFSMAAAIWWTVSGIIAAGIGGLTAGRLAGEPKRSTAGWHGLISWAASILFLTLLMTTAAGALTAGPFNIVMGGNAQAGAPAAETSMLGGTAGMAGGTVDGTDNAITGMAGDAYTGTAGETYGATPDAGAAGGTAAMDEQTAETMSTAALAGAVALILGALAAWYAGCAGAIEARTNPRLDGRRDDVIH